MKKLLASIIILLIFNISFAQKSKTHLLKNYDFYIEKNIEMGKSRTKYYLSNGLISVQENYWKNELRNRTQFEYDRFGNVEREINTYDINEGNVNYVSNFKLEYNDSLLIRKECSCGTTFEYSDFDELGRPKRIETKLIETEQSKFETLPSRKFIKYYDNGNIEKLTEYNAYKDLNEEIFILISKIYFTYDVNNNVIEIHREYIPEQKFPIPSEGGPFLYEYEYFRYKYNKNGLWTKKYKRVKEKEKIISKRKYN